MVETIGGEPADGAAEVLDRPLPDGVRRRVVQIVSESFGGLTSANCRAAATVCPVHPNRRAKFAGNAMASALETDAVFRQRIGENSGRHNRNSPAPSTPVRRRPPPTR